MTSPGFIGRRAELDRLNVLLSRVGSPRRDLPGVAVLLRGRRRVGKSRLVQVFCQRAGIPSVFFQASQGADPIAEREAFASAIRESDLPDRTLFTEGTTFPTWLAFFRQLASSLPDDTPSIVVIDELPWLIEGDQALEGVLQTAWDTLLARKPVLFILIGSDLAMMEALDDYRRPFHQRGTVMVLPPLNPAEIGSMLELPPADAIDAHLITGGLPLICQEWESGQSLEEFLSQSLTDPTSALLVSGERSLAAEFPAQLQARAVLTSIGSGERTWSGIRNELSTEDHPMAGSSLAKILHQLEAKRAIAVDTPLSTKAAEKDRRYRVADSYLRFYLSFLQAGLPLVERGRADLLVRRVLRSWPAWRGRVVEPVIREALLRIAIEQGWPQVEAVGGWWNRQNNPEVDLVGADRAPVAKHIYFVGSIKWHVSQVFGRRDFTVLARDMSAIPGADDQTELIVVSRNGVDKDLPARSLSSADLIGAWRA